MLNTYEDNESQYIIKFIYQSLSIKGVESTGLKSKKVTIEQTPIIGGGNIIALRKIGIDFSLYNKVMVVE